MMSRRLCPNLPKMKEVSRICDWVVNLTCITLLMILDPFGSLKDPSAACLDWSHPRALPITASSTSTNFWHRLKADMVWAVIQTEPGLLSGSSPKAEKDPSFSW